MKKIFLVILISLNTSVAAAAAATISCLPRKVVVHALNNDFQEYQVGLGLEKGGQLVEIFVSEKNNGLTPAQKSFSVLITYQNGISCVIAAGKNWQYIGATRKIK